MLKETLRILNDNKMFSLSKVSSELNISSEMAEDIILQLTRMGYISKSETPTCTSSACTSCAYSSNCSKELVKYYQLTEKGRVFLN